MTQKATRTIRNREPETQEPPRQRAAMNRTVSLSSVPSGEHPLANPHRPGAPRAPARPPSRRSSLVESSIQRLEEERLPPPAPASAAIAAAPIGGASRKDDLRSRRAALVAETESAVEALRRTVEEARSDLEERERSSLWRSRRSSLIGGCGCGVSPSNLREKLAESLRREAEADAVAQELLEQKNRLRRQLRDFKEETTEHRRVVAEERGMMANLKKELDAFMEATVVCRRIAVPKQKGLSPQRLSPSSGRSAALMATARCLSSFRGMEVSPRLTMNSGRDVWRGTPSA